MLSPAWAAACAAVTNFCILHAVTEGASPIALRSSLARSRFRHGATAPPTQASSALSLSVNLASAPKMNFPHNINTLMFAWVAGCAAMTETRGQTRRLTRWPPAVKPRTTGQALFVFNSSPVSSWRVGATHATISALSLSVTWRAQKQWKFPHNISMLMHAWAAACAAVTSFCIFHAVTEGASPNCLRSASTVPASVMARRRHPRNDQRTVLIGKPGECSKNEFSA
jgi:hypothetical protein